MILHLTATDVTVTAAADDGTGPARTISGVAVPWNVDRPVSSGQTVRFLPGSLPVDGTAPKFLRDHDATKPLGLVVDRAETDAGMTFTARVSATRDGDEALTLAADGVLDAVSVGVEPVVFHQDGSVLVIELAEWHELSLLPFGAYPQAKVTQVAAAEPTTPPPPDTPEDTPMTDTTNDVAAAPVVPTSPIIISGAPAAKITAAEWISHTASGRPFPASVQAAVAEMVTDDTPGLMPEPIIGQVYGQLAPRRPLVAALGTTGMPQGEVFFRRKITQHTEVGEQVAQFDELASQALTISKVQVNKRTFGGVVDLSEQEINWSDPAAVGLVLSDMAAVYARTTEAYAATTLVDGTTETLPIASFTDGDEVLDAFYTASATIAAAIDELPTHLFVSLDRWADLGKMKAANGDRLFPAVGPSNAGGTMTPGAYSNVLGLSVVVSTQFAPGTMILGNPVGIELFEDSRGAVRVDQPATLSVRLAWRGYFASVVLDAGAFVGLVLD